MENSVPSNVWTYYARWHRYFASLIETNVFEISCLLCMSFCFVILYVTIWCKDNKLIIYLSIWCKDNKLIFYLSILLLHFSNDKFGLFLAVFNFGDLSLKICTPLHFRWAYSSLIEVHLLFIGSFHNVVNAFGKLVTLLSSFLHLDHAGPNLSGVVTCSLRKKVWILWTLVENVKVLFPSCNLLNHASN